MSSKFGPKHPKIVEINSSIKRFKQEIIDQIQQIRKSIKAELDQSEFVANLIQQNQGLQQQAALFHAEDSVN